MVKKEIKYEEEKEHFNSKETDQTGNSSNFPNTGNKQYDLISSLHQPCSV